MRVVLKTVITIISLPAILVGAMKGSIVDIKSTWKRRTVLCLIFPLAAGLLIVMELLDTLIEMSSSAVVTFKQTWKGV